MVKEVHTTDISSTQAIWTTKDTQGECTTMTNSKLHQLTHMWTGEIFGRSALSPGQTIRAPYQELRGLY